MQLNCPNFECQINFPFSDASPNMPTSAKIYGDSECSLNLLTSFESPLCLMKGLYVENSVDARVINGRPLYFDQRYIRTIDFLEPQEKKKFP